MRIATRDDAREPVRGQPLRPGRVPERPRQDPVGEHVLAVHAQAEARDGDADLRGRDVAVLPARVAQDTLHEPRERLLPRGARVDRRPRRADDGELRGDEERR